jgi:WD40 repeat protein
MNYLMRVAAIVLGAAAVLAAQTPAIQWMRGGAGISGFQGTFGLSSDVVLTADGTTLKWWRISDGMLLRTTMPFNGMGGYHRISRDRQLLAVMGYDPEAKVKIIRTSDGAIQAAIPTAASGGMSLSPDGGVLAVGCYGCYDGDGVKLYSTLTGAYLKTLSYTDAGGLHYWGLSGIAYSPDGWINGYWPYSYYLTSIPGNGGGPAVFYPGGYNPSYSPDGRWLVIGNDIGTTIFRNICIACAGYTPDSVLAARIAYPVFSTDSTRMLAGSGMYSPALAVTMYDTATWQPRFTVPIDGVTNWQSCCTTYDFTTDGQKFAVADSSSLNLWNANDGSVLRRISGHIADIMGLTWSADSSKLLSGGARDGMRLWAGSTGAPLAVFPQAPGTAGMMSAALSPDGQYAAGGTIVLTGGGNVQLGQNFNVYRVSDGQLVYSAPGGVALAYSPDGTIVAAANSGFMRLYAASNGALLRSGPVAYDYAFAFTPDGSKIVTASGSGFGVYRASDLAQLSLVYTGGSMATRSVAVSPDGETFATGLVSRGPGDPMIALWRVSDGSLVRYFGSGTGASDIFAVAFSPDGHTLAGGGLPTELSIFNVADGALLRTFSDEVKVFQAGGNVKIEKIAYSPDGSKLAWGRADATVVVAANPYYTPPKPADSTPPVIDAAALAGTVGANGWFTSDVTVHWSASDAESGIATPCNPTTVTASTTVSCAVTNGAGLTASRSAVIRIDKTPPSISAPTITGTLGNNGWYRSAVTAAWTVADADSGIASSAGCAPPALTADTPGATLTCTASNSAGLSSSASMSVKIDATPPAAAATRTPGPNANGWNNSPVTVTFSGSDATSGVASCSAPVTFGVEGRGQIASGACVDKAGNPSAPATATVNLDRAPPVISGMPAAGCSLWPIDHKLVTVATVTVSDALSGPSSFQVTATSSEPNDPANPSIVVTRTPAGAYTVQLMADRSGKTSARLYTIAAAASDVAGNTASATSTCTVPHDRGQ